MKSHQQTTFGQFNYKNSWKWHIQNKKQNTWKLNWKKVSNNKVPRCNRKRNEIEVPQSPKNETEQKRGTITANDSQPRKFQIIISSKLV